jgi:acetyltransferase-like isoleucine patch superfamily enzyme
MLRNGIYRFFPHLRDKMIREEYQRRGVVVGKNTDIVESHFEVHSRVAAHASVRYSSVGKYSSIGRYSKINYADIGKFCAISWDTTVGAVSHPFENLSVNAFPYSSRLGMIEKDAERTIERTFVGHDVWIGANVVVMPGAKIGNGSVIGASSVITKSIPAYSIVVGNPGRVVRNRFSDEIVNKLLEMEWWNADDDILRQNITLFQMPVNMDMLMKLEDILNNPE